MREKNQKIHNCSHIYPALLLYFVRRFFIFVSFFKSLDLYNLKKKKKDYYLCKEENEKREKDKKDIKKKLSENLSSAINVEDKLHLSFSLSLFHQTIHSSYLF